MVWPDSSPRVNNFGRLAAARATRRRKNHRAAVRLSGIPNLKSTAVLSNRFASIAGYFNHLADRISGLSLGFMIGAHKQFRDQAHQDRLEAHDKDHCAHLEKGRAQNADI